MSYSLCLIKCLPPVESFEVINKGNEISIIVNYEVNYGETSKVNYEMALLFMK